MTTTTATSTAAGQATVGLARPKAGHHAEGSGGERQHGARAVLTAPGAWPLLSTSVIARLPLAMLSLVLLVHTERVTGSFALAGLAGAPAVAITMRRSRTVNRQVVHPPGTAIA